MTASRARRLGVRLALLAVLASPARGILAQSAPVQVIALGEGRSFLTAMAAAIRMAVESGAGATVQSAIAAHGNHLTTDSVRAVSRGVVTSYLVLDSGAIAGGVRVRILAMVSRIAERDAVGARGRRVDAPGQLWTANAAVEFSRTADEGQLLSEIFGAIDRQPSAYSYEVEAGPPIPSGTNLRQRLRVIRSPSAAYGSLRDRARSILSAVAGTAGSRTLHLPPLASELVEVRACVSHCDPAERRVINPRVALDDTDSLGGFDPPVMTSVTSTKVRTFFPDLGSAGGYAVAFADSSKGRQELVHVRSTRGYLAVVDYIRSTFDDARFHLDVGEHGMDLLESFRAPWTGQPQHRFASTATLGTMPISLVQGFRPRTSGGPGAATSLGSPYVVLTLPAPEISHADTALVDVWLTPAQLSQVSEFGVAPLGLTHRLPDITCSTPKPPRDGSAGARMTCVRPSATDVVWRTLDDESRVAPAPDIVPTGAAAGVPLAVLDAISHPPLAVGDGAIAITVTEQPSVVAVGSATVDPAAPTQACAVARLRAQRELLRYLVGSRLEGRIGLASSESRGGQVQEFFREEVTETVAGQLMAAALAAQWAVSSPARCRVALWLSGGIPTMPRSRP